MAGEAAVEAAVDDRLELFHPDADRKGLRLGREPRFQRHPEGVPGGMADRQNQPFGGGPFPARPDGGEAAVFDLQPVEGRPEADFPAAGDNLLPHRADDQPELVGADVGLGPAEGLGGAPWRPKVSRT